MHRSTNLSLFSLVLSHHTPEPTTFDNPTELPTDASSTTSPHVLKGTLLQRVTTMPQEADKRMKSSQLRCKDDHDRQFRNAPLSFNSRQYTYLDQAPVTTCAVQSQATGSYNRMMPLIQDRLGKSMYHRRQLRSKETEI